MRPVLAKTSSVACDAVEGVQLPACSNAKVHFLLGIRTVIPAFAAVPSLQSPVAVVFEAFGNFCNLVMVLPSDPLYLQPVLPRQFFHLDFFRAWGDQFSTQ